MTKLKVTLKYRYSSTGNTAFNYNLTKGLTKE